ncbi:glutamine--fructose-6-phosphate transaminase (isomerizing) [Mycolicibacterium sp. GCM10028919]|uniref:glutamine--fructose-6-phosphate transaminase (isomerizing) n=1 Tax=Mycolicibacterium sp. GCM10028919 TaxID=3273401 RepID=UPI00361DD5D1
MCGIIACRTQLPAIDYLLVALRRLEYRGYDSVGVAVQTTTGDVARLRTVGRIGELERDVRDWAGPVLDGRGIGHTRWATHGAVTEGNAHPHADCDGRITLVHNGIIENADVLRESLTAAGHHFASLVDSEVLCHLIEDELRLRGDLMDAVQAALPRVEGSWALAVLEQGTGRLVVAAHRSPLIVARTAHGDFATSDVAAIADWADRFHVLEDGDVVELTGRGRWRSQGVDVGAPVSIPCTLRHRDADLNGYADFMAKEIDEQPAAAARVLDELGDGIADGSLWASLGMAPFERLQVIGCGTSLNAGFVIGHLARRLGGLPVRCVVGSEAAEEVWEPRTLCLAISQSGETADVLDALAFRRADESPLLALTNNTHSTLARRADAFVPCVAGQEIGVAATKTFVCQVIAGAAVMISALVGTRRLSSSSAARLVDDLRRVPDQLAGARTVADFLVPQIAEEVSTASGFLFLARGSGLPYAAEGALKLKELTYRWAESYPAGELKHGPLALIENGTPVVVIDDGDAKLACNIAEVEARGGRIIRIGRAGSTVPVVPDDVAPWGPLEAIIPLQVLARSVALGLGRDVDKPRNLAKSVTVG